MNCLFPCVLLLWFFHLFPEFISLELNSRNPRVMRCVASERKALLDFKKGLTHDPSGRLNSWAADDHDCCRWLGVGCSNRTGHLTRLDLKNPCEPDCYSLGLGGEIASSLVDLKHLQYLDLSYNNFEGIPIPSFIGSLKDLKYFNLSCASFGGMVPPYLGNLSNLVYLDLNGFGNYGYQIWVSDMNWISGLHSLKYLHLGDANLSLATSHWFEAMNNLPSLLELHLPYCELTHLPQSLPSLNLTSLSVLNLHGNSFNSLMPGWLSNITTLVKLNLFSSRIHGTISNIQWRNLCNLEVLDLSDNQLVGEIKEFLDGLCECNTNTSLKELQLEINHFSGELPESIQCLKNLSSLELWRNSLSGSIPSSIGKLSMLEVLYISENAMNGTIPERVGQLHKLRSLQLEENSWNGDISEVHFHSLSNLKYLYVSSSNKSLAVKLGNKWIPPFSLKQIIVKDCQMSTTFPAWLSTQNELTVLYFEKIPVSGNVPPWFWKLTPNLQFLSFTRTQLSGNLPKTMTFSPRAYIDLSNNLFDGPLSLFYNVTITIPRFVWKLFEG